MIRIGNTGRSAGLVCECSQTQCPEKDVLIRTDDVFCENHDVGGLALDGSRYPHWDAASSRAMIQVPEKESHALCLPSSKTLVTNCIESPL